MFAGPCGGLLFGGSADLADQHECARRRVCGEEFECVTEGGADDRVAADAEAGGLTDASIRHRLHRLVGQRSRATDHTNVTR